MSLETLISISKTYGSNPEFVIAGGGNTSWKNDEYMFVKGSGTELATIEEEGFVKVNLQKLDTIWSRTYSEDSDLRKARRDPVLKLCCMPFCLSALLCILIRLWLTGLAAVEMEPKLYLSYLKIQQYGSLLPIQVILLPKWLKRKSKGIWPMEMTFLN